MATGIVHSAICFVLTETDPMQMQDSCGERVRESREQLCKFLQAINEDQTLEIFDKFSSSLLSVLEKCLSTCLSSVGPCRSKSVQREKLWTAFHSLSIRELPKLWSELFTSGEDQGHTIPKLSPLVYQNVNQRLYEDLIKSHVCSQSTGACRLAGVPQLSEDEENIVRYAAGYVALKLLKKYERSGTPPSMWSAYLQWQLLEMIVVCWSTHVNGLDKLIEVDFLKSVICVTLCSGKLN